MSDFSNYGNYAQGYNPYFAAQMQQAPIAPAINPAFANPITQYPQDSYNPTFGTENTEAAQMQTGDLGNHGTSKALKVGGFIAAALLIGATIATAGKFKGAEKAVGLVAKEGGVGILSREFGSELVKNLNPFKWFKAAKSEAADKVAQNVEKEVKTHFGGYKIRRGSSKFKIKEGHIGNKLETAAQGKALTPDEIHLARQKDLDTVFGGSETVAQVVKESPKPGFLKTAEEMIAERHS